LEQKSKATIIWLILNGDSEKAIELLAKHHGVSVPKIKVGLPKGRKKQILGCYKAKDKTIFVLNSDALREPFIILHEFYHHLRTTPDAKHRGTEKNANEFAKDFIQAYKSMVVVKKAQGHNLPSA
jgi:Zn-dependent peptidase ImmA (M78 family)